MNVKEKRQCEINILYDAHINMTTHKNKMKEYGKKYNAVIADFIIKREKDNHSLLNIVDTNIDFMQKLFVVKGYPNENVIDYFSKYYDNLNIMIMPLDELSLKLYILGTLGLDMDVLFNDPKVITRYSSDELYAAACVLREKPFEIRLEDFKLYLHLNNRQKHENDKKLSDIKRFMFSKQYINEIEKELNKE